MRELGRGEGATPPSSHRPWVECDSGPNPSVVTIESVASSGSRWPIPTASNASFQSLPQHLLPPGSRLSRRPSTPTAEDPPNLVSRCPASSSGAPSRRSHRMADACRRAGLTLPTCVGPAAVAAADVRAQELLVARL